MSQQPTKVFNFKDDDHDNNIFAFLQHVFYDFVKEDIDFDQSIAHPFAKLIFNSGNDEILFYEINDGTGRLAWWDDNCGELLSTEKEMEVNDLLIELKKLVA